MENLLRQALEQLRSKWSLPKFGLLAGGALANTAWNLKTGNSAPVNDIDIFQFQELDEDFLNQNPSIARSLKTGSECDPNELSKYHHHKQVSRDLIEFDYGGGEFIYSIKKFYIIRKVWKDGMLNFISYSTDSPNPLFVIQSFDINCCQVGYDLENDKFYWTPEFEKFISDGILKVVNLSSPHHTTIRIAKKEAELGSTLLDSELDLLVIAINSGRFFDSAKYRFKERYAQMFRDNQTRLESRFHMETDAPLMEWLASQNLLKEEVYKLNSSWTVDDILRKYKYQKDVYPIQESVITNINYSPIILYWFRNILLNDSVYHDLWENLWMGADYKSNDYFDTIPTKYDLELLKALFTHSKVSFKSLGGKKLSEQIELVKTVFDNFDQRVGISILEKGSIEQIDFSDDLEKDFVKLKHRGARISQRKINKIFGENSQNVGYDDMGEVFSIQLPF